MLHLDSLMHRCSACSGLQEVLFGAVPVTGEEAACCKAGTMRCLLSWRTGKV